MDADKPLDERDQPFHEERDDPFQQERDKPFHEEREKPLRERVVDQGEETLGKLAQDLLESPVVSGALSAAFGTRERAMRAQELALAALNLPSASDLERLTRRIRNVSQRLEGIEDALDRLEQRVGQLAQRAEHERDVPALDERLGALVAALERLECALAASKPAV
jgi:septal ring factor EnvC (AmiA/AmiB activator)